MSLPSLACYPKKFKECVVSENKICIQFQDVQSKVRLGECGYGGAYHGPNSDWLFPFSNARTDLNTVAIGLPLHEHRSLLLGLLRSYKEHIQRFPSSLFILDLFDVKEELEKLLPKSAGGEEWQSTHMNVPVVSLSPGLTMEEDSTQS